MFKFIVLVAFLGLAAAAPLDSESAAETQRLDNVVSLAGDTFHYGFKTSNGIEIASAGDAKVISGTYQYVAPGGELVKVEYSADDNGFHPSGALLPTPPPVPVAIIRALEWISAHPQAQESSSRKN